MIRLVRSAGAVLGCVCLLTWMAPDVSAQGKKGKPPSAKAKAKGKGKGKGPSQTQNYGLAIRDLQEARIWLAEAAPIFDGHRGRAYVYAGNAISELMQANATGGSVKGKGKSASVKKGGGTGTTVVKAKNNNVLPAGWEVAVGQMQQAGMLVQSAISKIKGTDPHAQAASAQAQLALQEINAGISFMNSLGGTTGTASKKKGKGR